ncbi:zinc-ribbon domain-containing protein, partial [Escherichia coli]|uniref:zinc-ribbon domain-containing protein n=1 Tax=Escherichia coli TaxID=562 RepID=UPI002076EE5A
MNGIKTGLGITPGEHIISADSALSRNIRQCFCLSCHGRLILQTDAQGAWFEHDLYALSEQQKAACVVLNPEKSHPYIEDMVNRPGFPGECFICELRLPDHRFRWKHNKLFLLLPEE